MNADGPDVVAPSTQAREQAASRLAALATPAGALGGLGDLAVWISAVQDACPPRPFENVRAVVFAGDHGAGVSAYPREVTALMVRSFLAGDAGVAVLARQHGVHLRVLDLGVDDDLAGVPAEVTAHKVRRSSGPIHLRDALSGAETDAALRAGARIAAEEVAAGADLLIGGDMGIGNTTPAAALIAGCLGLPAREVTGRGTGIGPEALRRKEAVIEAALRRAGDRVDDPVDVLTTLGSADLAATVGFLVAAARHRVPVVLDGVVSVACALVAEQLAPGAAAWFTAGHRSPEPAQSVALDKLGLVPLLDLGLRLGEGSGAMAALPLVHSASRLLRETALLREVVGE